VIRLYGFNTQNTLKALYVLEESGLDFEFEYVDLAKGEQRSDEFAQKSLMRKVPLLEHDGEFLFESGAICRYIGKVNDDIL
jgi:glutathione S-transferase